MAEANQADLQGRRTIQQFQASKLTEQEAADLAGLHVNTVKKILRGTRVHRHSLLKLERALQAPPSSSESQNVQSVQPLHPSGTTSAARAQVRQAIMQADGLHRLVGDLARAAAGRRASITIQEISELATLLRLTETQVGVLSSLVTDDGNKE